MTLSARNFYLTALMLLACGTAIAATPPDAEMAAAATAMAAAERLQPRGDAADTLAQSRDRFTRAQQAMARRKYRDAASLADESRASADLALAQARLARARMDLDEKAARNADLRRQLLVLPGKTP